MTQGTAQGHLLLKAHTGAIGASQLSVGGFQEHRRRDQLEENNVGKPLSCPTSSMYPDTSSRGYQLHGTGSRENRHPYLLGTCS